MTAAQGDLSPDGSKRRQVLQLLHRAAAKAVGESDPFAKFEMEKLPAERVIRHLYHPPTVSTGGTWSSDETIVKMQPMAFTHGAMRHCFRLKKRAQPPKSATNHHWHKISWSYASNYIAKAYADPNSNEFSVDCSDEAKEAVRNDIMLQYEAQRWGELFNAQQPPSQIHFIRAYALEFPDRPGCPWFAVERFISGKDLYYGRAFHKHNTNGGFVDTELRRVTPQIFSAFSFYKSHGKRLVADIQGVGDLYTDPQVLSDDYRFGDGDLGPRGMALFFHSYRSCGTSDALGIPIFPLSRNEIKAQAKYEEEEVTISDDEHSMLSTEENAHHLLDTFQKLDLNRQRRASILHRPHDMLPLNRQDTMRRSNVALDRTSVRDQVRKSLSVPSPKPLFLRRTRSDIDEVHLCLERAMKDRVFTHRDFHRLESGELRERTFREAAGSDDDDDDDDGEKHEESGDGQPKTFHKSAKIRAISAPLSITNETKKNLGKVHYQLAVLHGTGRFPKAVPTPKHDEILTGNKANHVPDHDSFSVLFHLSHAASLQNAPACLALGRVLTGFGTNVSPLLSSLVPVDFQQAKRLLYRAMTTSLDSTAPVKPKAAAGCLLFQILQDEVQMGMAETADTEMMNVLNLTIELIDAVEAQGKQANEHTTRRKGASGQATRLQKGDRVEADYFLEGTFYPATVENVSGSPGDCQVTVVYDDDGSSETLPLEKVRLLVPPTATQTSLGGPLSDGEAFGGSNSGDDGFLLAKYELQHELAVLKEKEGILEEATALYESAADGAIAAGKMKTATEWSLKAAAIAK